jgi:four helix bundle protein
MAEQSTQTDHRELPVWHNARELVKMVYKMTGRFPESERFGLTMRMRRCAVAIVSAIAEAYGRRAERRRERSLDLARGSAFELETQLVLAGDLGFAYNVDKEIAAVHDVIEQLDELTREDV